MKYLISFISIVIDILLLNVYRITPMNLNYFYPMFTITSLVFISNLYLNSNRKNYYYFVLIIALIYDSVVNNNLLITISLFEVIAIINIKLKKHLSNNLFNNILRTILSIFIYDFLFHLLLFIVRYQDFSIIKVFYKFYHSLILNIIYITVMFFVLKNKKNNKDY